MKTSSISTLPLSELSEGDRGSGFVFGGPRDDPGCWPCRTPRAPGDRSSGVASVGAEYSIVQTKPRHRAAQRQGVPQAAATQPNQRWAMYFVHQRLVDERWIRMLTVLDQATRERALSVELQ